MEVPLTKFEVKGYRNDVVNYYTVFLEIAESFGIQKI